MDGEPKNQGWDMSRRDAAFFARITESLPAYFDEELVQHRELRKQYLEPAHEAYKNGQHGKGQRLEELYSRQFKWLTKDRPSIF